MDKELRKQETKELVEQLRNDVQSDFENPPQPKKKATNKLTEKQKRLAVLYASRQFHGMSMQEMSDLVGISVQTGYYNSRQHHFRQYVDEILDDQNKEFLAFVYQRLQDIIQNSKSEKNALDGIKIFLQMTGKMQEGKEITHKIQQTEETKSQEEREKQIIEMEKELLEDNGNEELGN